MEKIKNNKKKILFTLIIVIAILIIWNIAFGIYYSKALTKRLNEYKNNTKAIMVKYLYVDDNGNTYTKPSDMISHFDDFLTYTQIKTTNFKKGNYYVLNIKNITNKKIIPKIVSATFAYGDMSGHVVNDCIYDKKTQEIKVPKKYYKKYSDTIQVEFLVRLNKKDVQKNKINVIEKGFAKNKTIYRNLMNSPVQTSVNISKRLNKQNIQVKINDNIILPSENVKYNRNTGLLTLDVSPANINKISIEKRSLLSRFLKLTLVKAADKIYTYNGLDIQEITVTKVPASGTTGKITGNLRLQASDNSNAIILTSDSVSLPSFEGNTPKDRADNFLANLKDYLNTNNFGNAGPNKGYNASSGDLRYWASIKFTAANLKKQNIVTKGGHGGGGWIPANCITVSSSLLGNNADPTIKYVTNKGYVVVDNTPKFRFRVVHDGDDDSKGFIFFINDPSENYYAPEGTNDGYSQLIVSMLHYKVDNTPHGGVTYYKELISANDDEDVIKDGWQFSVESERCTTTCSGSCTTGKCTKKACSGKTDRTCSKNADCIVSHVDDNGKTVIDHDYGTCTCVMRITHTPSEWCDHESDCESGYKKTYSSKKESGYYGCSSKNGCGAAPDNASGVFEFKKWTNKDGEFTITLDDIKPLMFSDFDHADFNTCGSMGVRVIEDVDLNQGGAPLRKDSSGVVKPELQYTGVSNNHQWSNVYNNEVEVMTIDTNKNVSSYNYYRAYTNIQDRYYVRFAKQNKNSAGVTTPINSNLDNANSVSFSTNNVSTGGTKFGISGDVTQNSSTSINLGDVYIPASNEMGKINLASCKASDLVTYAMLPSETQVEASEQGGYQCINNQKVWTAESESAKTPKMQYNPDTGLYECLAGASATITNPHVKHCVQIVKRDLATNQRICVSDTDKGCLFKSRNNNDESDTREKWDQYEDNALRAKFALVNSDGTAYLDINGNETSNPVYAYSNEYTGYTNYSGLQEGVCSPKEIYIKEITAPETFTVDSEIKHITPTEMDENNTGTNNCSNANVEFRDPRLKINWIKTTDYKDKYAELDSIYTDPLHNKEELNGAKFKVAALDPNDNNKITGYLKVQYTDEKETIPKKVDVPDTNKVKKKCYIVKDLKQTEASASIVETGDVATDEDLKAGKHEYGQACVIGFPIGNYKIIEVQPAQYHSFGDKDNIIQEANKDFYPIVTNDTKDRNAFYNCPTEYEFTKTVSNDINDSADQVAETTEELQHLLFNIKGKTGTYNDKVILFYEMDDPNTPMLKKKRVYEYAGYLDNNQQIIERQASDCNPHNGVENCAKHNITKDLQVNENRKFRVKFLPWEANSGNSFATYEIENPNLKDTSNQDCYTEGFYLAEEQPQTSIKPITGTCKVNIDKHGGAAKVTINNPVNEINFTKDDFYKYFSDETLSEEEQKKEFDTIDFLFHTTNGSTPNKNLCLEEISQGLYRYRIKEGTQGCTSALHTKDGDLKIKHLCTNRDYQIEEISQPNQGNLIIDPNHPKVNFHVNKTNSEGIVKKDAETKIIYNKPTEIRFQKRDLKYGYIINDTDVREHYENLRNLATFNLRRCRDVKLEDCNLDNSELVSLTDRHLIGTNDHPDEEDYGKLAYTYPNIRKDSQGENLVEDLHLYKGDLIIRYLPSGYYDKDENGRNGKYHEFSYILVETKAPAGYDLPTNGNEITRFRVPRDTVNVDVIEIPNKPTKVILEKYDMTTGKRLRGAKFKLYKVPNDENGNSKYDSNKSLLNQQMEEMKLHTVRDGEYEKRYNPDVLDTDIITTCYDNCNDITQDLYTRFSNGRYENTPLANEEKEIEILQGQAIIQYLEVNTYYILEEVKAPDGYKLPENKEDRFKLIYLPASDDNVVTKFEQPNEENYFQFYKFDEYNNLLDGAKFKLQKLDDNKKYHEVNVEYDEERSNILNLPVYRMIDVTKDTEVLDDKDDKATDENKTEEEKTDENKDSTENKENKEEKNIITTKNGTATIFRLAEGQYRILEVEAAPGKELPKKTINVATFFVDSDGKIYGNSIITNKKPTVPNIVKPSASAELQVDVQTGKLRVRYSIIIISIICVIGLLIYIINRKKEK